MTKQEKLELHLRKMEINDLKHGLDRAQVWQFRMLIELFNLLKQFTACKNSDIDPVLLAKAQSWITQLDRLLEIDE